METKRFCQFEITIDFFRFNYISMLLCLCQILTHKDGPRAERVEELVRAIAITEQLLQRTRNNSLQASLVSRHNVFQKC